MKRAPVGVSILTNGSRLSYLRFCLKTLLAHTTYRPLVIGVFDNGSTDDTWDFLQEWAGETLKGVECRIDRSETDLGCGPGTNRAMDMVRDCEFAIHLESDFSLLAPSESGAKRTWLQQAVEFMQEHECDYLYLRRMVDEREMLAHFWSQWMPKVTDVEGDYMRCPDFWFSQNPHLRRNDALYASKTLPVKEFYDEQGNPADFKGTPAWNKSEMAAPKPPNAWLHRWGLFVHERKETDSALPKQMGCGKFDRCGVSTCKYGFFMRNTDGPWCSSCDADKDFRDMLEHETRLRARLSGQITGEPRSYENARILGVIADPSHLAEFTSIMEGMNGATSVLAVKGSRGDIPIDTPEVYGYDELESLLPKADAVVFPCMDEDMRTFVRTKVLPLGLPVIAKERFAGDLMEHQRTGFVYDHFSWAVRWLRFVLDAGYSAEQRNVIRFPGKNGVKVTFITPTFRRDFDVVKRCIGCVQAQSIREWEHLICSDGEFDFAIDQYVKALDDDRVRYSCTRERVEGSYGNLVRDQMLKVAQGEYVVFFDDDNVVSPEYAEKMVAAVEAKEGADFAVCRCLHFGPLQEYLGPPPVVLNGVPPKLYEIDTLQVLVRREVMQGVGWSNEFGYFTDGNTFEAMAKEHAYAEVPETLAFHL